jgi:hypothetical protein
MSRSFLEDCRPAIAAERYSLLTSLGLFERAKAALRVWSHTFGSACFVSLTERQRLITKAISSSSQSARNGLHGLKLFASGTAKWVRPRRKGLAIFAQQPVGLSRTQLHTNRAVEVQTFGINATKHLEHESAHAVRTAFQITGALLSLTRSVPSLN